MSNFTKKKYKHKLINIEKIFWPYVEMYKFSLSLVQNDILNLSKKKSWYKSSAKKFFIDSATSVVFFNII